MTSALDIINDAALFAEVGDKYNALSAESEQLYLRLLNNLLDSESTQEYSIYDIQDGTIPVVVSQAQYTIGVGFSLNVQPPPMVEVVTIVDSSNNTYSCREIGTKEWANIRYKPAPGRPYVWYYELGAPTAVLNLWPTPAFAGDVIHVFYGVALTQFTNLASVLVAPQGMEMFLKTSLGELIAMWEKKDLSPAKMARIQKARSFYRDNNAPVKVLAIDVPTDYPGYAYNIYTDNQ